MDDKKIITQVAAPDQRTVCREERGAEDRATAGVLLTTKTLGVRQEGLQNRKTHGKI